MLHRRLATAAGAARRAALFLVLATALLLSTVGPPSLVGAAPAPQRMPEQAPAGTLDPGPPPEPAARIQVVIKSVTISNDRDRFGGGEILLTTRFWSCSGPAPTCSASDANPAVLVAEARRSLNGDSGDTVPIERVVPRAAEVKDDASASEETGLALYAGRGYLLTFNAFERDVTGGDFMGGIQRTVDGSNGWGIAVYELEPAGHVADTSLPALDGFCAGCGDVIVGDYLLTYEIRTTPLADLRPTAIRIPDTSAGDQEQACLHVGNRGQADAGPFQATLRLDGNALDGGTHDAVGLGAGASEEYCLTPNLPSLGRHQLLLTVDSGGTVVEADEANNRLEQAFVPRRPEAAGPGGTAGVNADPDAPAPDPVITRPAGSQPPGVAKPGVVEIPPADLQVGAVEVKARDGGRCVIRGTRNIVTATIVNAGDRPSGEFAIEVRVGSQRRSRVTIQGVAARSERTIDLGDAGIARGERAIEVIVDPDNKVTEGDEKNNTKTVAVDCVAG